VLAAREFGYITLTDFANRASVVIYTIDPRGLQTLGVTAADEVAQPTAENLNRISADRNDELFETQAGLSYLAEETGGYTVKNTNDISSGLKRILTDQSYYLIGYERIPIFRCASSNSTSSDPHYTTGHSRAISQRLFNVSTKLAPRRRLQQHWTNRSCCARIAIRDK
jgi:hypothetical protein